MRVEYLPKTASSHVAGGAGGAGGVGVGDAPFWGRLAKVNSSNNDQFSLR